MTPLPLISPFRPQGKGASVTYRGGEGHALPIDLRRDSYYFRAG